MACTASEKNFRLQRRQRQRSPVLGAKLNKNAREQRSNNKVCAMMTRLRRTCTIESKNDTKGCCCLNRKLFLCCACRVGSNARHSKWQQTTRQIVRNQFTSTDAAIWWCHLRFRQRSTLCRTCLKTVQQLARPTGAELVVEQDGRLNQESEHAKGRGSPSWML
jgi:hypothetical protein